jgi:hypothetical protein
MSFRDQVLQSVLFVVEIRPARHAPDRLPWTLA